MSGSWSHGKGDRNRGDIKKYEKGWDRIFGKKPKQSAKDGSKKK